MTGVPSAADGSFTADFGTQSVPPEAYPLLNDPFLTVNEFVLTGKTTSTDSFCGFVSGYAQVIGMSPSDRIRLEGSTFGAARITGDTLPTPDEFLLRPESMRGSGRRGSQPPAVPQESKHGQSSLNRTDTDGAATR